MRLGSIWWRYVFPGVALLFFVHGAAPAQARIHGLTGNARFQIGDGLAQSGGGHVGLGQLEFPLPVGSTAVPNGKVAAIAGATLMQHGVHTAGDPAQVVIDPFQLGFDAPPNNMPVFVPGGHVFQVHTNLTYMFPRAAAVFAAGRRTGASTVTFCGKAGSTVTAMGNPQCAGGSVGTGLLRYTRTTNQFGGPAQAHVGGSADVALRGGGTAPCAGNCIVAFIYADPAPTGAVGAPFGFANTTVQAVPNMGAFWGGTVTAMGAVLNVGMWIGPGLGNTGMSWGGPWTTGMVTASQIEAFPPEVFQVTGMDARASGSGPGMLSLVAGGFSQRMINGANANRGWLNLTIGSQTSHVPLMPAAGVATLVAVTAAVGALALRGLRRR